MGDKFNIKLGFNSIQIHRESIDINKTSKPNRHRLQ